MAKRLDQAREAIRVRHDGIRTEQAYLGWVRQFIHSHGTRHPAELSASPRPPRHGINAASAEDFRRLARIL